MQVVIIDNYDSYTYNLCQGLAEIVGREPTVLRNDAVALDASVVTEADAIVISPGPGRPESVRDFGVGSNLIRTSRIPLLGVCLGHQGIAHAFGGEVIPAPSIVHGRVSQISHSGDELFAGIEQGFQAVRYHSLAVNAPLPSQLEEIAWTEDGLLMGLRHRERPIWGVQFHPESIGTPAGMALLRNFVEIARGYGRGRASVFQSSAEDAVPEDPGRDGQNGRGRRSSTYSLWVEPVQGLPDPARAFCKLFGDDQYAFWLDSSLVGGRQGRYSFMGTANAPGGEILSYVAGSRKVGRLAPDTGAQRWESGTIFTALSSGLADAFQSSRLPFDFDCGYVGYFGYELKGECGAAMAHRADTPDASFMFAPVVVALDHASETSYALCLAGPDLPVEAAKRRSKALAEELTQIVAAGPLPLLPTTGRGELEFSMALNRDEYLNAVELSQRELVAGESYEICLTNRIETEVRADPLETYLELRRGSPAPHAAFLRFGDCSVLSSSPERFLKISTDGFVESMPIKGTRRRGATRSEDEALINDLATSVKDRAENLMIVDLLRNDIGRVCETGSVTVPEFMQVKTYEHVHQLVSTIRGRLRGDRSPLDCVADCFPGGSMTGAPKIRTMEIIDALEPNARGIYSGALGFLGLSGGVDLSIVIRTLVLNGGHASIGAGGAVTVLSDPEAELDEMLVKARPLMDGLNMTAADERRMTSSVSDG